MHLAIAILIAALASAAYAGSVYMSKKPRNPGDEYEIIE